MRMIDFTDCDPDLAAHYGGSDAKRGIIYQGKRYMLKVSDRIPDAKRNDWNSSYTNSSFSEYIGCHVMESVGIQTQHTLLGTVSQESSSGYWKVYPVVACENFIPEDCELVEFKVIQAALTYERPSKIPKLSDIYAIMKGENEYFSQSFGNVALSRYWDVFIVDALLGNFDRHAYNWGYLVNKSTREISLAPVYDCGSCLYPQLTDDVLPKILTSPDEISIRIEKFPTAALLLENGEKASYMGYIASLENQDCTDALLRIVPRIDINKIGEIIDGIDSLSDIRKTFYKTILSERFERILLPPYRKVIEQDFCVSEDGVDLEGPEEYVHRM